MTTTTTPEIITLEQSLRESKGNGRTLDELKAGYHETVKEVEAEYGPHVPSLYLHLLPKRGRPKNGETVERVQSKAIKMPPAIWQELKTVSIKEGVTLHALVRTVLLDYLAKK